jgi:signal transduction histidine kinase
VDSFIADAGLAGRLDASLMGCEFEVRIVDPALSVTANRNLLHAALANLLQNAFKFTQPHTVVTLSAIAVEDRIHIEVADHCGGLPPGSARRMFVPFAENDHRKAGMGLGLSIARHSVESDFGTLTVRDIPGKGCIFTIDLPRYVEPVK